MKLSRFGARITGQSGISDLMDDLGDALANKPEMIMMGGGNPGHIPEVSKCFQRLLQDLANDAELAHSTVGVYDQPAGDQSFRQKLAAYLSGQLDQEIDASQIVVTNGTQTSLFMLFNLFAGPGEDNVNRKILLPMLPEYIGYADTGIDPALFHSLAPKVEPTSAHRFRYRPDFEELSTLDDIGAVCVSRPGNPTGNIISTPDLEELDEFAKSWGVPLIIDGAYGLPFPNLIYRDSKVYFSDNTILTLSLSKLGLPAVRTGIVVAPKAIAKRLATMNAIMSLAPASLGQALMSPLLEGGKLDALCAQHVRPHYLAKRDALLEAADRHFQAHGVDYEIHEPDGAMFLWIHFPSLRISSQALYEILREREVLVVSGHYFFFGTSEPGLHSDRCIRVTYSQNSDKVLAGIEIIAKTVAEFA